MSASTRRAAYFDTLLGESFRTQILEGDDDSMGFRPLSARGLVPDPAKEAKERNDRAGLGIALAVLLLVALFMYLGRDIQPITPVWKFHDGEYGDLIATVLITLSAAALAYLPPFRSVLRRSAWKLVRGSSGGRAWAGLLLPLLLLPAAGGLLNRLSAGWLEGSGHLPVRCRWAATVPRAR
jgi:hypothetical protein